MGVRMCSDDRGEERGVLEGGGTHCQMDEGPGSEGTYNVSARYLRSAAVG
jgi:hypothetical protein